MPGPARTAFPAAGNPITASQLASFVYPNSGGEVAPVGDDKLTLLGWAVSEVNGASASVRLHDGANASAPAIGTLVTLSANGFQQMLSFPNGVEINSGKLYIEVVSGKIEITLYW